MFKGYGYAWGEILRLYFEENAQDEPVSRDAMFVRKKNRIKWGKRGIKYRREKVGGEGGGKKP